MALVQLANVQAPTPEPLRGTLLDAATVVDGMPVGMLKESDLYESWSCLRLFAANMCEPTPPPKKFMSPGWPGSAFFSVYGGVTCKGPGFDFDAAPGKLQTAFAGLESSGVEAGIAEHLFTQDGTVDLGGPMDLLDAIGVLEGYFAANYSGIPTLHLPRNLVVQLCNYGALNTSGIPWRLCTGTKVAAGAGYMSSVGPDGSPAASGTQWLYMTGEVSVWRSGLTSAPAIDTSTNDMMFLVERSYLVAADCLIAAVQVNSAHVPDDGWQPPAPVSLSVTCEELSPGVVEATAVVS